MGYPATGPSFLQPLKSLIKIEGVGKEREREREREKKKRTERKKEKG